VFADGCRGDGVAVSHSGDLLGRREGLGQYLDVDKGVLTCKEINDMGAITASLNHGGNVAMNPHVN